jgi:N-acetylmuramoyl-L-alanine amidase
MLDPGHGGKDSGAIGPNKTMEKMVVLSISKKLQNLLNQEPGIDARMTRKGDYFISLRQRLNIARKNRAQLFVAIHADAFNNNTASGASVFALSEHGATSEAARWLAERENTSELSGIDLKVKDRELKLVLLDMSQTATIDDSLQLGHSMLVALAKLTRLHTNRVEQAGFVVLKSPDIPSVLVETGFISNPSEEKLLVASPYQDRIARALEQGIASYFKQNPPPDSWFEMQFKNTQ